MSSTRNSGRVDCKLNGASAPLFCYASALFLLLISRAEQRRHRHVRQPTLRAASSARFCSQLLSAKQQPATTTNRAAIFFHFLLRASQTIFIAGLWAGVLSSAEHRGNVTSSGVAIPGAVVTATQSNKNLSATTDERGFYSFPDLADGLWVVEVDMPGFEKIVREVHVSATAAPMEWNLKLERSASEAPSALQPTVRLRPTAEYVDMTAAAPNPDAIDAGLRELAASVNDTQLVTGGRRRATHKKYNG